MNNLHVIEETYQKYRKNFDQRIPDGLFSVDLQLLYHFDLLHFKPLTDTIDPLSSRSFHIVETPDKMTLINDEFVIWIVPDQSANITHCLIALNKGEQAPQLEAAFIASGVYNQTRLLLKLLDKFLTEIHETEIALSTYEKTA